MNQLRYYEEKDNVRTIRKESIFLLLGNGIDGWVNIDQHVFASFDELRLDLKSTLKKIEGQGEWRVCLYAVDSDFRITQKYGYYRVPRRGKLLYSYSYMSAKLLDVEFVDQTIVFLGCDLEFDDSGVDGLTIERTRVTIRTT